MFSITERIHRLRRVVLVHSIIYYRLNRTIMPDSRFDELALELACLQINAPELSKEVPYYYDAFFDFTGETGFHLPLTDPRANNVAQHLLREFDRSFERRSK